MGQMNGGEQDGLSPVCGDDIFLTVTGVRRIGCIVRRRITSVDETLTSFRQSTKPCFRLHALKVANMKKLIRYLAVLPLVAVFTFITVSSLSNKLVQSFKARAQDKRQPEGKPLERTPDGRPPIRRRLDKVPEIVLETPSLEVSAEVKFLHEFSDFLVLHIRNKSAKAVVNFTICTRITESGGASVGFAAGEAVPPEYILPYGEKTIEILASNIEPDHPLTICAVTFADGSQEGLPDPLYLDWGKEAWEEDKKRRGLPR